MDAVLRELHAQRAEALFLEVDETNAPAIALYRRLGFANVGRREGYYSSATGAKTGALVMRRDLG
jgi:[ribosomal protein S18]-alanine N-acetyltransferase